MCNNQTDDCACDHADEHEGGHVVARLLEQPHRKDSGEENIDEGDIAPCCLAEDKRAVHADCKGGNDAHNADKSRPYPGIPELLEQLQSLGLQIAVASNKYQAATQKLIAHYFPKINFVAVFGQREGVNVKPDPTIVDDILSIAKTDRKDVLYVGDSGVDMQTAINAGVTSCGVTWGFRPRTELEEFHPDYIADKAEEILKRIN